MTRKPSWILSWAAVGLLAFATVGCGGGAPSTPKPKPKPKATTDKSDSNSSSKESNKSDSVAADAPAAGGWGTLTGKFIFDGTPPKQSPVQITKDVEYCSKHAPLTEELVVNPENKGIQNVVFMLSLGRGEKPPKPRDSNAEAATATVQMDNQWCRFEPHVQFVQAGQTLEFGNEDEMGHNVKGSPFSNPEFNQTVVAKSKLDVKLDSPERLPFKVSCTIHPWMNGYVVVQDHPYVAISGEDGSFELKNVPSGKWTFQVWQEKAGYLEMVKIGGKETKLSRGRWDVNVYDDAKEGNAKKNALGDILVEPSNFKD